MSSWHGLNLQGPDIEVTYTSGAERRTRVRAYLRATEPLAAGELLRCAALIDTSGLLSVEVDIVEGSPAASWLQARVKDQRRFTVQCDFADVGMVVSLQRGGMHCLWMMPRLLKAVSYRMLRGQERL